MLDSIGRSIRFSRTRISHSAVLAYPCCINSGHRRDGSVVRLCNDCRIARTGIARATGRTSHIYIKSALAGPNAERQRLLSNSIDTCYSLSTVGRTIGLLLTICQQEIFIEPNSAAILKVDTRNRKLKKANCIGWRWDGCP